MFIAGHRLAILAALFMASPLAAQQSTPGHLPSEDLTSRSVPPAPPPERYSPPPFPKFSRTAPEKTVRAVAKRKHVVVHREQRRVAHKSTKAEPRHPSSRERKDQRWCASLSKKQLSRNSKCRKILASKKSAVEAPRHSTRQDRIDERRCGKLTLKQVLRDRQCRAFAQRELAGTKAHHAKAKTSVAERQVKKSSTKQRQSKRRSRR